MFNQAEKTKKEPLRPGTASVSFTGSNAMPARSASLPNIAKVFGHKFWMTKQ